MENRDVSAKAPRVSHMAQNLIGSEIIRLAGEVNERIARGEQVYNLTIGDFDPAIFPIPDLLNQEIRKAYEEGHTNYPSANGIPALRKAVSSFLAETGNLHYSAEDILIAGGARPLIYALYRTILDPDEIVVYPVPSWNNNHYTHLAGARGIEIQTLPTNGFMPSAEEIRPYLSTASLIALCTPLNPTGTVMYRPRLEEICQVIMEENVRRKGQKKPLYLMFDQIYWALTYGEMEHCDPVSLFPEMRDYTIYIDGLSKAFAATGVRVGWAFGPADILSKMRAILGHVGAWAPKAEQVATARYLADSTLCSPYLNWIRRELSQRLNAIYEGFCALREEGFMVDAIAPEAAIYLTVKVDLRGKSFAGGKLNTMSDVTSFLLTEAGVALVPFYAFGASADSPWFRLSVGTIRSEDIPGIISSLRRALNTLK